MTEMSRVLALKKITARLRRETRGKSNKVLYKKRGGLILDEPERPLVVPKMTVKRLRFLNAQRAYDSSVWKMSTIAWWMIKYVLLRCSRFCFTNIVMVRIFRMTMARHLVLKTANQRKHYSAGTGIQLFHSVIFWWVWFVLLPLEFLFFQRLKWPDLKMKPKSSTIAIISFQHFVWHIPKLLRAIFRENRKSHDTREKNEFFFLSPKHPF